MADEQTEQNAKLQELRKKVAFLAQVKTLEDQFLSIEHEPTVSKVVSTRLIKKLFDRVRMSPKQESPKVYFALLQKLIGMLPAKSQQAEKLLIDTLKKQIDVRMKSVMDKRFFTGAARKVKSFLAKNTSKPKAAERAAILWDVARGGPGNLPVNELFP